MDLPVRVAKLEALAEKSSERLAAIAEHGAAIKVHLTGCATKEDLALLRVDVHKAINEQSWKIIGWITGISTALVAATFFLARYVR